MAGAGVVIVSSMSILGESSTRGNCFATIYRDIIKFTKFPTKKKLRWKYSPAGGVWWRAGVAGFRLQC